MSRAAVAAGFALLAAGTFSAPWNLGGFPWLLIAVAVWNVADAALIEFRRWRGEYGGTPTEAIEAALYVIRRRRDGGDGGGSIEPVFNEQRHSRRAEGPLGSLEAAR